MSTSPSKKYTTPIDGDAHLWVHQGTEWVIFNERDQAALNRGGEAVLVLGGRWEANTASRTMHAIYGETIVSISRASWFVQSSPFLEEDSKAISFWTRSASSLVDPLILPDGRKVYKANDQIYLAPSSLLSASKLLVRIGDPECPVAAPAAMGDAPEVECSHLLICVHGIGESLWSKKSFGQTPFETNVNAFRSLLVDPADHTKSRVEVLYIEWYHILANSSYAKRIADITLGTIPLFRQLANEAISDVIFYLNPEHRERVLVHVADRYVELVTLFKERNPSFSGKVSLVGHSLGSVICFDLLNSATTKLTVDNLFLLGSPLGMFWTAQGTKGADFLPLKNCKGAIYNIYQPNDPVAYRLEPYLIPCLKNIEPMLVPYHKTGGMTAHVQMKHAASSIMGLFAPKETNSTYFQRLSEVYSGPTPPKSDSELGIAIEEIKHINADSRIDWSVQEGLIGGATEYADAIGAHTSYFNNADVARFIANNIK